MAEVVEYFLLVFWRNERHTRLGRDAMPVPLEELALDDLGRQENVQYLFLLHAEDTNAGWLVMDTPLVGGEQLRPQEQAVATMLPTELQVADATMELVPPRQHHGPHTIQKMWLLQRLSILGRDLGSTK